MGILDAPSITKVAGDRTFGKPLRHCSTRGQVNDPQSNGTDTIATSRIRFPIPQKTVAVRLVWANMLMTSGVAESLNPYTVTIKAAIEDTTLITGRTSTAANLVPVFFNGKRTATLEPGAILMSDPVLINVPDNWAIFVRTCVTATSGDKWPTNYATSTTGSVQTDGSGVSEGVMLSDQTDSPTASAFTASSSFAFGPTGIITEAVSDLPTRAVGIIGDSIAKGFLISRPIGSYLHQASMNAGIPTMRLALGGDAFASAKSQVNIWKRMQLARFVHSVICNYGINDVRAGNSLATIKADALAFWAMLGNMGIGVHQATLLPNPGASTDGYLTASNQSIVNSSWETVRTAFNSWLRDTSASGAIAQSGGALKSIIDGAALCEVNAAGALTLNGGRFLPLAASPVVSGTATGFTTSTITDTGKSRTTNQDQYLAMFINSATTGSGQITRISSNTATVWTMNPTIALPTGTVTYSVVNSPTWDHLHPSEALHVFLTALLDLAFLRAG